MDNRQYEVLIYNGNGVVGMAGETAELLERYGLNIAGLRNADHYNYEVTQIEYYDSEVEEIADGIRDLLGGELNYLGEEERDNNEQRKDLRIILGHDMVSENDESI